MDKIYVLLIHIMIILIKSIQLEGGEGLSTISTRMIMFVYFFFRNAVKRYLTIVTKEMKNKPDRATMRPDCVSACIEHVT